MKKNIEKIQKTKKIKYLEKNGRGKIGKRKIGESKKNMDGKECK